VHGSDPHVHPPRATPDTNEADRLLRRLVTDRFVRRVGGGLVTLPRWHAALARAAHELHAAGEELTDLRVPVAWVVTQHYGDSASDAELATLVWLMTQAVADEAGPG
jgi:hypothetical protein